MNRKIIFGAILCLLVSGSASSADAGVFKNICTTAKGIPSKIGDTGNLCISKTGILVYSAKDKDSVYRCLGYLLDILFSTGKPGTCVIFVDSDSDSANIKGLMPLFERMGAGVLILRPGI